MEHAVIIHYSLSNDEFGSDVDFDAMVALSDDLTAAIEAAGAGEFDGNEPGGGECALYMYGPDADRLFATIRPIIIDRALLRGGYVIKRHGSPDDPLAQETTLPL